MLDSRKSRYLLHRRYGSPSQFHRSSNSEAIFLSPVPAGIRNGTSDLPERIVAAWKPVLTINLGKTFVSLGAEKHSPCQIILRVTEKQPIPHVAQAMREVVAREKPTKMSHLGLELRAAAEQVFNPLGMGERHSVPLCK